MSAPATAALTVPSRPAFRLGPVSLVWRPAMVATNLALVGVVFLLLCVNIGRGDFPLPLAQVAEVLLGGGSKVERFIVVDLRLPRSLVGLLVGLALGLSGAVTQSLTRNPLASPDILGITAGASAAAVAVILFGGSFAVGSALGLPLAALLGGLLTAVAVYLLAWRGGVGGFRLILVGIGVNAALVAVTEWMLVVSDIRDVARANVWLNGSLNGRDWHQVWPTATTVAVVGAVAVAAVFALSALKLGEDTAKALGGRVRLGQAVLLAASVVLAAVSVAAAGPIGFVAFVAPQVAVRLVRAAGPPLVTSALTGAALVVGGDVVARTLLPVELPVGIVTTAVGGPFLMYLIVRANRKATA